MCSDWSKLDLSVDSTSKSLEYLLGSSVSLLATMNTTLLGDAV